MLTAARLRELLDYDSATGAFIWRLAAHAAYMRAALEQFGEFARAG